MAAYAASFALPSMECTIERGGLSLGLPAGVDVTTFGGTFLNCAGTVPSMVTGLTVNCSMSLVRESYRSLGLLCTGRHFEHHVAGSVNCVERRQCEKAHQSSSHHADKQGLFHPQNPPYK